MTATTRAPLPLPQRLRSQLETVVTALAERDDIALIILFGSWAEGKAKDESDIDLLVVADTDDRLQLTLTLADLLRPLLEGRALDLIVVPAEKWAHFRRVRGMIGWEADRFGVKLYER
jgi:predicted nucleotidyltransferase